MNFEQIEEIFNFNTQFLSLFLGLCFKGEINPVGELLDKDGIRRFLFATSDFEKFVATKIFKENL